MTPTTISAQTYRDIERILTDTFRLPGFRPLQQEIITNVLAGRSQLAILPTGGGKSLCYQLPSLLLPHPTLVVSPLIALMKDQVDGLQSLGIAAEALTSRDPLDRQRQILTRWHRGTLRILYVAPERLRHPEWARLIGRSPISLLVVDEAHCISEWGHDFRPDYRRIRKFHQDINTPPILALTATATPRVKTDIVRQLGLEGQSPAILEGSINRDNVRLAVTIHRSRVQQDEAVRRALTEDRGAAIVYADTRADVERWAGWLKEALSEPVLAYHAGLSHQARTEVQDAFMRGGHRLVVATNAFGMGIDRADITRVIHVGVPESIDAYYQEIGRAGRQGEAAAAAMHIRRQDLDRRQWLLNNDRPRPAAINHIVDRLAAWPMSHPARWDIPADYLSTTIVLSLIEEMGYAYIPVQAPGYLMVQRTGDVPPSLSRLVEDRLGAQFARRQARWAQMKTFVTTSGCRRAHVLNYFGKPLVQPPARCCDRCDGTAPAPEVAPPPAAGHSALFERLRQWRRQVAGAEAIAPYRILSDADLTALAARQPQTLEALALCRGIGPVKLARYGAELLAILRQAPAPADADTAAPDAYTHACQLFAEGLPLAEVARLIGRRVATARGYLVAWIAEDAGPRWRWYAQCQLTDGEYQEIRDAFLSEGDQKLSPVYRRLGGRIGYDRLEIARAVFRRLGPDTLLTPSD